MLRPSCFLETRQGESTLFKTVVIILQKLWEKNKHFDEKIAEKLQIFQLGKPSLKLKIMEFSIIGLTPLPPPFWPKLWKILKNINYFMASKSGLVLK